MDETTREQVSDLLGMVVDRAADVLDAWNREDHASVASALGIAQRDLALAAFHYQRLIGELNQDYPKQTAWWDTFINNDERPEQAWLWHEIYIRAQAAATEVQKEMFGVIGPSVELADMEEDNKEEE